MQSGALSSLNVLSHVPASSMTDVAEDLKAVFKVRRQKTARALAEEFVELYAKSYPKAVSVFESGIEDALTYLSHVFPFQPQQFSFPKPHRDDHDIESL